MKKILITFIALMLLLSVSASAVTVEFIIGDATMAKVQNGTAERNLETSPLLAAPYISNDRTMVPVRAVAESFNCNVGWDGVTRKVTITSTDKEINLFIDSTTAYVNGQEVTLDVAPQITNDITFVPVRFVTENMGYNVAYIPEVKSVLVYDQANPESNGTVSVFPLYDILNYYIYMVNGFYPTGAVLKETKALSLYFEDAEKFAVENNLAIGKEFTPEASDYDNCYANNLLKGEYAELMKSFGYENAFSNYHAENSIEEIYAKYESEYVCAQHILVEDKAIADKVYKLAAKGEDFDALIKEYGKDPGMEANPNGYVFTTGEMVKEFETATFALGENKISKPVQSQYGYHIIKRLPLPDMTNEILSALVQIMYSDPILEKHYK